MKTKTCSICGGDFKTHTCTFVCEACRSVRVAIQTQMIATTAWRIRHGEIPKAKALSCVDCGKPAHDYDHRRYREPLNIVPVCRSCNVRRGAAEDMRELVRLRRAA